MLATPDQWRRKTFASRIVSSRLGSGSGSGLRSLLSLIDIDDFLFQSFAKLLSVYVLPFKLIQSFYALFIFISLTLILPFFFMPKLVFLKILLFSVSQLRHFGV